MDHIATNGGRFLTVLPKTRGEDKGFRAWIPHHAPDWLEVQRLPGRRKEDPPQVWWAFPWPEPSADGYRICWMRSSQKMVHAAISRTDRLRRGTCQGF